MLIKPFDARAYRFVESEVQMAARSCEIDAAERSGKVHAPTRGIIPPELYDANVSGTGYVVVVQPNDSLVAVVRALLALYGLRHEVARKDVAA